MIISVANPIYDSVFKFLLEDELIVKIFLRRAAARLYDGCAEGL